MSKMVMVKDARHNIKGTTAKEFAKEMGISEAQAEAVLRYVSDPTVPGDSIVVLDEAIIGGVRFGAGNVML